MITRISINIHCEKRKKKPDWNETYGEILNFLSRHLITNLKAVSTLGHILKSLLNLGDIDVKQAQQYRG